MKDLEKATHVLEVKDHKKELLCLSRDSCLNTVIRLIRSMHSSEKDLLDFPEGVPQSKGIVNTVGVPFARQWKA